MTDLEQETIPDLSARLGRLQIEHYDLVMILVKMVDPYSELRSELQDHLRKNYARALDNTKKTAGIDTLELWAASDMPEFNYALYISCKEKREWLSGIIDSLEVDISAVQSRINAFKLT